VRRRSNGRSSGSDSRSRSGRVDAPARVLSIDDWPLARDGNGLLQRTDSQFDRDSFSSATSQREIATERAEAGKRGVELVLTALQSNEGEFSTAVRGRTALVRPGEFDGDTWQHGAA
jgi:hypothetical protein